MVPAHVYISAELIQNQTYLESSAIGGEEEGDGEGEEAFDDEEVLPSQPLRPLPRVEAHQLLHR